MMSGDNDQAPAPPPPSPEPPPEPYYPTMELIEKGDKPEGLETR